MKNTIIDYSKPARTRIAPSPTGELHLGTLRTILYDYALAKRTGGQFVYRIENTDTKRYVEDAENRMMDITLEFGLNWDEGVRVGGPDAPYSQLERVEKGIYSNYYEQLLKTGSVYRCFCTKERLDMIRQDLKKMGRVPMYDKHCRNLTQDEIVKNLNESKPFTIRIKMPKDETIEFMDPIRGKMTWNSNDVDDYILVKSDNIPTYHGAVVIDDYLMKITHVIRSAEWIPTTPVYLTLAKYLNISAPMIVHPSVLLDPISGGKMSKRKSGEFAFADSYLDKGYIPQAILNYIMYLGWSHPDERVNVLSIEEFCKVFSIERLQPQPSKVDFAKIDWYGGQYMRQVPKDRLFEMFNIWIQKIKNKDLKQKSLIWLERIHNDPKKIENILLLIQDRMKKFSDLFDLGEFFYTHSTNNIDWEKDNHNKDESIQLLKYLSQTLKNTLRENIWMQQDWEKEIRNLADQHGWKHGDLFMLLRLSIVGSAYSPNMLEVLNLLGPDQVFTRIESFYDQKI